MIRTSTVVFLILLASVASAKELVFKKIAADKISVHSVSSQEDGKSAAAAIDGDVDTIWHTKWIGGADEHPHEIVLDLGDIYNINMVTYLPRQDASANGDVSEYAVYIGVDANHWGRAVAVGTFSGGKALKEIHFDSKAGRYVRFVAVSETGGRPFASAAEIGAHVNSDVLALGLEWDANDDKVDGYRVFMREGDGPYDYTDSVCETRETTCTVYCADSGVDYYFVARAYVGYRESKDSNEASYMHTIAAPGNLRLTLSNIGD